MKTAAVPSLKGRALRWLSMREYTRAELGQRMAPFEEAPGQVQTILDELEKKGLLSDARAAQSLVYRRQARLGATRIRQELRSKGVPAELVAEQVAELRSTERQRAQAVWAQKFGAPATDRNGQLRQMRFLAARGFAGEVIRAVVPAAIGGRGDDDQDSLELDD
jgi:regulatory protein